MQLLKGQKVDVTKGKNLNEITLSFGWSARNAEIGIDAAAFLLSERGRCERDEDFIFYGNPVSQDDTVTHTVLSNGDKESITISLPRLPQQYARIALTLTIYEGEHLNHRMKDVSGLYLKLQDRLSGEELHRFEYGSDLSQETAIVVGELYRHGGEWKFSAVGSGFNGGLAALCINYGLEVEASGSAEVAATAEASAPLKPSAPVKQPAPPTPEPFKQTIPAPPAPAPTEPKEVLSSIDLRKKAVQFTLEKKQLTGVKARVGIVLDISGSMRDLYATGVVQEVVERILAVAAKFDDNGTLDVWVYDNEFSRLPSVTERDFGDYVKAHILNNRSIHKFGRNNEPPVMEDVIRKYTKEEKKDTTPVFIIFINDGGVLKLTKKVIMKAAVQPIFWQFVGIGNSDFEVLEGLDNMTGRVVDNADFVHLDRIEKVSDEELYDRLLNEFPYWIKAAKGKRILL
ncbi:General stress protein 16U [compost metagenome]